MFDLILRGGTVGTADGCYEADVAIRDGRIAAVGTGLGPARETLDAAGRLVLPGGVDPHCHIEQVSGMGLMNADTFETATASAAMGGTTTVISFAAQAKGQRLRDAVADYAARARRGAHIDHAFHILISDPTVPDLAADLAALAAEGHRSIKVFTTYNIGLDDRALMDVLAAARSAGALTCIHAENDGLIGWTKSRLLADGHHAPKHHALSHPRLAEIEAVERMCRFAEFLDTPVMLFHISTAEGVAAVRAARGRGVPVWAETCPHYLLMTGEVLDQPGLEGAKVMCSPPQRTKADQQALWQGLARRDLEVISSDHAPYRYDKTGKLTAGPGARFDQIANGLPGLETRLPLMFDAMVSRDGLGIEAFVDLTATRPARLYGLPSKGRIAPGCDADLVIWDPARQHRYGENDLHDNVGYNPWAGITVTGWPDTVIQRGAVIAAGGVLRAAPGQGRWLPRALATPPTGRPAAEVAYLESET
jgi:dihydropyrimidinase